MLETIMLTNATAQALSTTAGAIVSIVSFAMPIIIVAFAGMYSERSGVINLSLEGMMVFGAFAGFLVIKYLTDPNDPSQCIINPQLAVFIGILVAAVAGFLMSLLLSFAAIKLKGDQTIIGTAINTFVPALCIIISWRLFGAGQTNIYTPTWVRINYHPETLGVNSIADDASAAELNAFFWNKTLFSNLLLTTPVIIVLIILGWLFLFHTKTGLRLRACGENPQAADSVGINVSRMRFLGTSIGGILAGIGGFAVCLYIGYTASVAGLGFLALAVMIFGNWNPGRIILAGIFFALFRTLAEGNILPNIPSLSQSSYLYSTIPYLATLLILLFTSKRSHAPKAEGIPYDKGAR